MLKSGQLSQLELSYDVFTLLKCQSPLFFWRSELPLSPIALLEKVRYFNKSAQYESRSVEDFYCRCKEIHWTVHNWFFHKLYTQGQWGLYQEKGLPYLFCHLDFCFRPDFTYFGNDWIQQWRYAVFNSSQHLLAQVLHYLPDHSVLFYSFDYFDMVVSEDCKKFGA